MIRKVGGVPAAHVALHGLDRLRPGWSVVLHQKVAVLQQAAAPDGDYAREHGDVELDDHGEQGDDAETKEPRHSYCQAFYYNNPHKLMPDQTKRTLLKAAAHTGQCTPTHLH